MEQCTPYTVICIIYGNYSVLIATRLSALFQTIFLKTCNNKSQLARNLLSTFKTISFQDHNNVELYRNVRFEQSPCSLNKKENRSRQKYLPRSVFQISICCQGKMEIRGWCLCPGFGWFASPESCLALPQLCLASASLEEIPPFAKLA